MSAVRTHDLRRVYRSPDGRDIVALEGMSLDIEEGEIRGLLGPNGAGKTTLTKILSTVLLPTSGSASILGHDVVTDTAAVRRLIGVVFGGDRGLYTQLTARESLRYWAALYDVPVRETNRRVDALLDRVGLLERADTRVETYSRGMKQRLHLARGLISNARVLFLDEPTIGMDPLAARDFRQLVKDLKQNGCTILLTTHDMAEAEAVCDRVALIDHGRLIAVETPSSLARLISEHERVDFSHADHGLIEKIQILSGVRSVVNVSGGAYSHRIELAQSSALQPVLEFLVASGVRQIATSRPSLEEVYVHVIGDRGLKV
ncbi:daunorubicin resistance protein DrrA family ABC transporter ATP-binding protein [Oxalicibacterium flavum]|uniref:Daunorubicin resistance protein DrrA family ABC transporter ATP-binding protein n=1 Tax=Oxalicibacterium flavum TaxID=179467 RepID=A0A8J2XXC4_9BURK|nr:ABC transporter ATP-binding protein [Oxalicibacterium flavum]GGB99725.1 daunorubicin resistance protein DrrA family ABC transporter ATP-binding protein [Oxalicibacterium flavum]